MSRLIFMLVLGVMVGGTALAVKTPDADQVQAILADPSKLNDQVKGLSAFETAGFMRAVINEVQKTRLTMTEKNQVIALLVARAVVISGEDAPSMVGVLAEGQELDLLSVIVAAEVAAMEEDMESILEAFEDVFDENTAEAAMVKLSAEDPVGVLGQALYDLIKAQLYLFIGKQPPRQTALDDALLLPLTFTSVSNGVPAQPRPRPRRPPPVPQRYPGQ